MTNFGKNYELLLVASTFGQRAYANAHNPNQPTTGMTLRIDHQGLRPTRDNALAAGMTVASAARQTTQCQIDSDSMRTPRATLQLLRLAGDADVMYKANPRRQEHNMNL